MLLILSLVGLWVLFQIPPIATSGVTVLSGVILVGYGIVWLVISGKRRDARLGELVPRLAQLQEAYQARYGSSWMKDAALRFGDGFGEGYANAAAEQGDLGGFLLGQGIRLITEVIGESLVSEEQRRMAAQIQALQQEIDHVRGAHTFFSVIHSLVMIGTIVWWSEFRESPADTTARTPKQRTPTEASSRSPRSRMEELEGFWKDEATFEIYEAKVVKREGIETLEFARKSPPSGPSDPYGEGDVVFELKPTSIPIEFTTAMFLRPSLPPGVRLSKSARSKCVQTWSEIAGQRLVVLYSAPAEELPRLRGKFAKVSIPVSGLLIQGGGVIGCKPFDPKKVQAVDKSLVKVTQNLDGRTIE